MIPVAPVNEREYKMNNVKKSKTFSQTEGEDNH